MSILFRILTLASLTSLGCATTIPGIEEAHVDGLHGAWLWVSSNETEPRGTLILGADGKYVLAERSVWTRGRFRVYRVAGEESREPWLELQHAGSRRERVFQMVGRDTLLLRDGVDGYVVANSVVDLFVRAPSGTPVWGSGAWGTSLRGGSQPFDQEPVPITAAQPLYPPSARRGRITGTVVLRVLVGVDGRVQDVQIVQGVTGLTDAAVDAARMWVFQPAFKDGLPVTSWFEIPMVFKL